jgi:hypothetical protein
MTKVEIVIIENERENQCISQKALTSLGLMPSALTFGDALSSPTGSSPLGLNSAKPPSNAPIPISPLDIIPILLCL